MLIFLLCHFVADFIELVSAFNIGVWMSTSIVGLRRIFIGVLCVFVS